MTIDIGKVLAVITGVAKIVDLVKGAKKEDKVDAVLASLPDSFALSEMAVGRDLWNDAAIKAAVVAVVNAEHAVIEARKALKAIVLQKAG